MNNQASDFPLCRGDMDNQVPVSCVFWGMVRSDHLLASCTHFSDQQCQGPHSFFDSGWAGRHCCSSLSTCVEYRVVQWLSDACWNMCFRYSLTTDIPLFPCARSSPLAIVSGLGEGLLHFWQKSPGAHMCNTTLSCPLTCLLFFCLGNIFSRIGIFTFKEIISLIISFTANLGFCLVVCLFLLSLLNEILLLPGVTSSFCLPLLQRRLSSPGTAHGGCWFSPDSSMEIMLRTGFPITGNQLRGQKYPILHWYDGTAACSHCL